MMTWSQKDMNVYQTQLMTLRFQGKILCMHIRIKDFLLLEGKVELKFSRLSGLRINIYPSWINITISERNQEATLYLQELTSTLLSQRLCPVHLLVIHHKTGRVFHNFSQSLSLLRPYSIHCCFKFVVVFFTRL